MSRRPRADRIIIDLRKVTLLDSTGLNVMVSALHEDHRQRGSAAAGLLLVDERGDLRIAVASTEPGPAPGTAAVVIISRRLVEWAATTQDMGVPSASGHPHQSCSPGEAVQLERSR